ncbi:hypothetical protein J5N97_014046 [Dioscorea zingiberensis]|uniref:Phospholipid/glycerol acyltransferase domain-containing protein n=1 Tax=Dioscorea zingiberensis TaxID=325984 RepID=A0A9D5HJP0_9LILI|nr:hypothetical protein J5N97_014046 [Dioscorea zingiberensis]
MATELKNLSGSNGTLAQHENSPHAAAGQAKDQRPLLKSDSNAGVAAATESIEEMEKKYAPYVRRDVYGTLGRGPLETKEKVLLGLAMVILVPIRLVVGMLILVLYYLVCRICTLFSAPNRDEEQEDYSHMSGWRREVVVNCGRFLSRAMLFTLGFYWISESRRSLSDQDDSRGPNDESQMPGAIVSNHVSHLDILYHIKCLGCVYVQRESKSSDFKGVAEGTTTNGDFLLPFKTGAFLAKAPVLPVILRYPYSRFSPAWDSISGVRHIVLLLCQFVNYMEVVHLPVYYPSEEEKEDPKLYANNVRKLMAIEGNLVLSDIGLAEKRIYHAALNGLFSQS